MHTNLTLATAKCFFIQAIKLDSIDLLSMNASHIGAWENTHINTNTCEKKNETNTGAKEDESSEPDYSEVVFM